MRQATCALLVLGLILLGRPAGAQNLGTPAGGADMQSLSRQLGVDLNADATSSTKGASAPKISTITTGGDTGRAYVPPEGRSPSPTTLQALDRAASFLEKMGNTKEARQVRAMVADGKIRAMGNPTDNDMGETKGDYIYVNEERVNTSKGSVVGLAETLVHEMDHTTQTDRYQGASEVWGKATGGRPHEVDSYEKTIQTIDHWIYSKENELKWVTDPQKRAEIIKEIGGFISDNQTYLQAVADNGYEGIWNDMEIYSGGKEYDSATYAEHLRQKLQLYGSPDPSLGGGTLMGPSGPTGGGGGGIPAHCFPPMPVGPVGP